MHLRKVCTLVVQKCNGLLNAIGYANTAHSSSLLCDWASSVFNILSLNGRQCAILSSRVWMKAFTRDSTCTLIIHVQNGITALYIATHEGHKEVVQLLLQKHADVSISKMVPHSV